MTWARVGAALGRWLRRQPGCVCSLLAVLCYLNTLKAGFVYDDSRAIVHNRDVHGATPVWTLLRHDFWGTPLSHAGSHGSYRPLTVLTFRLTYALAGLRPAVYHATNVALHAVCSWMVAAAARSLAASRRAGLLAGALFAVHPVHSEAVAGLVGRADLLALLFTLCSLASYVRQAAPRCATARAGRWRTGWLAACVACAALAVLSKEQGIAALPLCLLYRVAVLNKVRLTSLVTLPRQDQRLVRLQQSCALLAAGCAVLLAGRLSVLDGRLPWFSAADNPLVASTSRLSRALTLLHLPAAGVGLLLRPHHLSFDWSESGLPPVTRLGDVRNLATVGFYVGLAALLYTSWRCPTPADGRGRLPRPTALGQPTVFCALGLSLVTFLPASNLFFYVGFLLAERVLYAPSVGFCLVVGRGLALLECRWRRLGPALSLLLLAVLATRTVVRNEDWRDERALYTAGLPYSPARALGNLATVLADQSRLEEAERAYRAALSVRSNMAEVHYNLGNLVYSQGRYDEATTCYRNAIGYRQLFAQAYLNLAHTYTKLRQPQAARQVLLICIDLNGSRMRDPRSHTSARVSCMVELGRLYAEHDNDPSLALKQYRLALEQASQEYNTETIYNLIGEAQYHLSNYEEAEHWFRKALDIQPEMVHAHIFYGKMLAKNKTRVEEAESWFHRAWETAPLNHLVYLHYGQFLYETGRLQKAADVYARGVELAPYEYDLTFNLANVYRELGVYQQAETYYRRATHIRPQDVQSHRNLGAILHVNGDLRQAEQAYLTALRLRPADHVTEVNLARLYRIMARRRLAPLAATGT